MGPVGPNLCSFGSDSGRTGRYHRAALGPTDPGARDLPRSGAQFPFALRQNQWSALAEPAALGRDSLGRAGVGVAFLHGVGSFRALSPETAQTTQDAGELGPTND